MMESWDLLRDLAPEYGFKLLAALVCGTLLGMERERKDKPAGLRTIVLITLGSTLFMVVSDLVALTTEGPDAITRVDPARIAAQVVSGIGFLGAGTIIQARGAVHGLTTAATIWVAAGIGLCIGAGFPGIAFVTTILVLLVLILLNPIRNWLSRSDEHRVISLLVRDDSLTRERVEHLLRINGVSDGDIAIQSYDDQFVQMLVSYQMSIESSQRLLDALSRFDGVRGHPGGTTPSTEGDLKG